MSYPNAYCVKCGAHTDTLKKHTVLLQNNARALKGVCSSCASEVYKILPKGIDFASKAKLTAEESRKYPDAFCVRCQEHTPTRQAFTVMLENHSRAVTGKCAKCNSDVYRIISPKEEGVVVKNEGAKVIQHPASAAPKRIASETPALRRHADAAAHSGRWSFVIAAGLIACIVAGFLSYSLLW